MLDEWEVAFSFPLLATGCIFESGVISSIEVAGEVVLVDSVTGVEGVTETPFSITRTTLFLRFKKGLFFLALIFAYIPWLNFVVISVKKKEKKEEWKR